MKYVESIIVINTNYNNSGKDEEYVLHHSMEQRGESHVELDLHYQVEMREEEDHACPTDDDIALVQGLDMALIQLDSNSILHTAYRIENKYKSYICRINYGTQWVVRLGVRPTFPG